VNPIGAWPDGRETVRISVGQWRVPGLAECSGAATRLTGSHAAGAEVEEGT
jgi:hypothetical protein